MYKLIASDVDGTLLSLDYRMNPANKTAIAKAVQNGIFFVLCSGRSYKSLKNIYKELQLPQDGYIISFNGGFIYDVKNDDVIYEEFLGLPLGLEAIKIYQNRKQKDIEMLIYTDYETVIAEEITNITDAYTSVSEISVLKSDDIIADAKQACNVIKIIFMAHNHVLQDFRKDIELVLGGKTDITFSTEFMLEIGSINCSKGIALAWLCDRLNIDLAQTIAIGDNYNDLPMINVAGLGVAVANAVDDLKQAAGYITEKTSAQGAIAEVIERLCLSF
ncbi:MAG: Cof-type HAD-IIB family hydrolase [Defluviitaleaceae bacterium]|nr:Cof-type HAD-IIB family hydrolase [Defluviitaleaceae bacterium]